jgi:hypothetical protein
VTCLQTELAKQTSDLLSKSKLACSELAKQTSELLAKSRPA